MIMMNVMCLIIQVLFLITTYFPPFGYICTNKKVFKIYLLAESITQVVLIIANFVFIFLLKEVVPYVLVSHLLIICIIKMLIDIYSRILFFNKLKTFIINDDLELLDSHSIRNHILEKYGKPYSIKEIEKALKKLVK